MNLGFEQIEGFSSYRINRLGQIWSDISNKFMKPQIDSFGYYITNLKGDDGKQKTVKFHQLVAITFLGHKPNGHTIVVDHINYNKLDNRLSNLQLISNRENLSKDAYRTKKSSLPLGISKAGNKYIFHSWYVSRYYKWGFKTLVQAIEMKETFESLEEMYSLEYAVCTLDALRCGKGKKSQAEINGDLIRLQ